MVRLGDPEPQSCASPVPALASHEPDGHDLSPHARRHDEPAARVAAVPDEPGVAVAPPSDPDAAMQRANATAQKDVADELERGAGLGLARVRRHAVDANVVGRRRVADAVIAAATRAAPSAAWLTLMFFRYPERVRLSTQVAPVFRLRSLLVQTRLFRNAVELSQRLWFAHATCGSVLSCAQRNPRSTDAATRS